MKESGNYLSEDRNGFRKLANEVRKRWKKLSIGGLLFLIVGFVLSNTLSLFWEKLIEPVVEDVVSQVRPGLEETIVAGNNAVPPHQAALSATSVPCPSGPPTQLRTNVRAIQMKPGYVKLLREPKIGLPGNVIGEIQKCDFVTILDGSTCAEEYNHFKVRTDDRQEGWAAEADNRLMKYWLVPALDGKKCNLPPIFVEGEIATSDHPNAGFIREDHSLDAAELSWTIVKGDTVKIIGGPVCNDTYIWYKVHGEKHPDPGWTELGRDSDYFFDIPDRIKVTNDPNAKATC